MLWAQSLICSIQAHQFNWLTASSSQLNLKSLLEALLRKVYCLVLTITPCNPRGGITLSWSMWLIIGYLRPMVSEVTPHFAPSVWRIYRVCDELRYCLNIYTVFTPTAYCNIRYQKVRIQAPLRFPFQRSLVTSTILRLLPVTILCFDKIVWMDRD